MYKETITKGNTHGCFSYFPQTPRYLLLNTTRGYRKTAASFGYLLEKLT